MPLTYPPSRNFGIDCLRGFAIVLVIVHHLALPFRLPLGPGLMGTWIPERLINAISFNGYEAVFMFFVISGFLITTRIIDHDGELESVNLRRFYHARARRIFPLLAIVLAMLTVLALLDVPGFAPDASLQTVWGLLASALTFTFNWYEGQTGWAPAGWDVLWSLSIEEVFYLAFPLLCRWLPRPMLVAVLLAWALAMMPMRALVPVQNEVWFEKAYLPGMAALAWGVLTAMLVRRWTPGPRPLRAFWMIGAICVVAAMGWSDLVHRFLFKSGLYVVCVGTCLLLFAFYQKPATPQRGLRWLAQMGALSYELYLSHMFIVLATVGAYRALLGDSETWNFIVYPPVLLCCHFLARLLARRTSLTSPSTR